MFRSSKAEYGDIAIGYVRLNRSLMQCVVEARVTPETSVNNVPYVTSVIVNELGKEVSSASCNCQAGMGTVEL